MTTSRLSPQAEAKPGIFARLLHAVVEEGPRWIRYLYFLRFSVFLWIFPLILWWANWPSNARWLTSGIVTPETRGQYLCIFFFLATLSVVALILARLVVINGEERFGEHPPKLLSRLLADPGARNEWVAPLLSQTNTAILAAYFFVNGAGEGVAWREVAIGLVAGASLSFLFWYSLTALYYLTYRPDIGKAAPTAAAMRCGKHAARTLILPRNLLGLSCAEGGPHFGDALEDAVTPLHGGWLRYAFPVSGYRWRDLPGSPLYEGIYFSILAAVGFFGLYWILWPLSAPVPCPTASQWALALEVLAGLAAYAVVLSAKPQGDGETLAANRRNLRIWKAILAVPMLGFTFSVPYLCLRLDVARFPTLALILILVIWLGWLIGAIAFCVDRFRVPVLTGFLLVLIVPRFFHWTGPKEEHYLSITLRSTPASLPTPSEIMDARIVMERQIAPPQRQGGGAIPTFFVVTATGGGIHAAGWTTEVLRHLEGQFGGQFHDHVLLLSTVSGGSAALLSYLRELHDINRGGTADWPRMVADAECSSLEAVGWGLVYYDAQKSVVPLLPYFFGPSSGIDDLTGTPLGKDRTWVLRRALERNLNNPHCKPAANPGLDVPRSQVTAAESEDEASYKQLTVSAFDPVSGKNPYPAFSMNTTTVENGSRFLLANYKVNPASDPGAPPSAESFLDVYGGLQPTGSGYVDLPLQTAAQLSATFPFVSSAATFPVLAGKQAVHFVDGGYYDNDGTGSVLEFLRTALDGSKELAAARPTGAVPAKGLAKAKPENSPKKVRILLVEIRNSREANAKPLPLALKDDAEKKCHAWNLGDQATAPLKAFYGGGHESVTARNRAILAVLEHAYSDRLVLRHFLITDETNGSDNVSCIPDKEPATDPLNWALTPHQRAEIGASAELYKARYEHIRNCFVDDAVCPQGEEEVPH